MKNMKEIVFKKEINAPKKKVWNTMLEADSYKQWTDVAWPGSTFEGEWKKNSDIRFVGPDSSGTLAHITEYEPYDRVVAKHIAILLQGGSEDRNSEAAQNWIGTLESYYFDEQDGKTKLTVKLNITPEWEQMFRDGWPKALDKLKEIVEN